MPPREICSITCMSSLQIKVGITEEFFLFNRSLKTVAQKAASMTLQLLLCIMVQGEYMELASF